MIPQKVSDACTFGAACLFGVSLATVNLVVQIIAGTLTAVAAGFSLYGVWQRTRRK